MAKTDLIPNCLNTRLLTGGLVGARFDTAHTSWTWRQECDEAAKYVGVEPDDWLGYGYFQYAVYLARPNDSNPFRILGKPIMFWVCQEADPMGGPSYSGRSILQNHKNRPHHKGAPAELTLSATFLEHAIRQEITTKVASEGRGVLESGEYLNVWHAIGQRLFRAWWMEQVNACAAMARIVDACSDVSKILTGLPA